MKRRTLLFRTLGLIILMMVAIGICGIGGATACTYDCSWEEACIVNHQPGCEQHFGTSVFDPYQMTWYCVENCSNPCSTNCFK
ncbi:MAG TPA: hypothetical protein PLO19_05875 [Candidatus Cryosericum sp.]|nr:hypothetical protein [Candidatus Cryosericum sp.]HPS70248.1 hypothetical protein [Candidatus Cryosericum sp.]